MKKNSVKGYALIGIIFILISVVSLAIPTSKNAAFWIAYIFTVVALAAQIVLWKRTFGHKELKSKFLGFPIVHIGIVYLIVQIAVLFVFVFAEKLPAWSALVICPAITAMAAIFMIAADVGRCLFFQAIRDTLFRLRYRFFLRRELSLKHGWSGEFRLLYVL